MKASLSEDYEFTTPPLPMHQSHVDLPARSTSRAVTAVVSVPAALSGRKTVVVQVHFIQSVQTERGTEIPDGRTKAIDLGACSKYPRIEKTKPT